MKRVTSRDVADYVGCSVSAVSLVVNNRHEGRINEQLRDRILTAVKLLNYRPNETARSLATQLRSTIALVCPDIRNPFFGELFYGLTQAVSGAFGVDLRVGEEGADYGPQTVDKAQAANIAGLVLANPSRDVLDRFQATCPTVLVDSPDSTLDLVRVDFDIGGAARQLGKHLLENGHLRVGYVDFARHKDTFEQRRGLLGEVLAAGGAELSGVTAVPEISVGAGLQAFLAVWPEWQRRRITAIVCADDVLAYGVISAARRLDIDVPANVSVASFNDIPFSRLLKPSLTSVGLQAAELGTQAGQRLLSLIAGKPAASIVLPTELQLRESSGSAPLAPRPS
ncbi:MAG: LacI family transcriptional regulator [Microbacteriaceae bacterium]|nr:MAG: LacI family transcriptional regulator [Microbacteriaceae bacterium]